MSQEFWLSLFPESVEVDPSADLPSFEPTPAEAFEEEFEGPGLDDEDIPFPPLDAPLLPYRDLSTPSSLTSSSGLTDSTDLTEDSANSEYSSVTHSTSSYQSPFDFAFRSVDFGSGSFGVDPKHTSMFTDPSVFTDPSEFFGSLGTPEFSPAIFGAVQVVKAQLDDGPYLPSVGISPYSLSATFPGPPPADPTDFSVGAFTVTQSNTGPMRKKFVCPECGHREYSFYYSFYSRDSMIAF